MNRFTIFVFRVSSASYSKFPLKFYKTSFLPVYNLIVVLVILSHIFSMKSLLLLVILLVLSIHHFLQFCIFQTSPYPNTCLSGFRTYAMCFCSINKSVSCISTGTTNNFALHIPFTDMFAFVFSTEYTPAFPLCQYRGFLSR